MAKALQRIQAPDRAAAASGPAPIGHNRGPPLEPPRNSWTQYCWRRAHKAAWRSPPVEVVRRRAARAAELGLAYRDYASILLDRGAPPNALVFDLGGTLVEIAAGGLALDGAGRIRPRPGVLDRLSRLRNCRVFVVSDQADGAQGTSANAAARRFMGQLARLCEGISLDYRLCPESPDSVSFLREPKPVMVRDLLAAHRLPPAAAILVGDGESDRRCAAAVRLAGFLWAQDYFGRGP